MALPAFCTSTSQRVGDISSAICNARHGNARWASSCGESAHPGHDSFRRKRGSEVSTLAARHRLGRDRLDLVGDGALDLIADLRGLGSVIRERPVERDGPGGILHELTVHAVERALRRADEQPEDERGHGRDQADPQLHDVLCVLAQTVLGQYGPEEHPEQRAAEDAHEGDPCDGQ